MKTITVSANRDDQFCLLSPLSPTIFVFDQVVCRSMESFLVSLLYGRISDYEYHNFVDFTGRPGVNEVSLQRNICSGSFSLSKEQLGDVKSRWRLTKSFCWEHELYEGDMMTELIKRAYRELCAQHEGFRKALVAAQESKLVHCCSQADATENESVISLQLCWFLEWLKTEVNR